MERIQLPPNTTVTVRVSSDLTNEPKRFDGSDGTPPFPAKGYYHRTVITLSDGTVLTFETPQPCVDKKRTYGGPFAFQTGANGLAADVEVFEAPCVNDQPGAFNQTLRTDKKLSANSATIFADGHQGAPNDWDDTVVNFTW